MLDKRIRNIESNSENPNTIRSETEFIRKDRMTAGAAQHGKEVYKNKAA
jgi:hypothetical protein